MNTSLFYKVLYFGKRGRENQCEVEASDLQLKTTTVGLKYLLLNEKASKMFLEVSVISTTRPSL